MGGERGDRWLTRSTVLVGLASVGFCGWIWARTDGLVATLGHLTSITRLTTNDANFLGLLSLDLLLLMVLLLARLPWLERTWGRDVLVRRHRLLGAWSIGLMLTHVGLFALQRGTRGGPVPGSEALERLFLTDRHMLLATIGTVALLLVTLSSSWRARQVLHYELWHLVHLWAYVGTGLVLPHVLVASDLAVGAITAYWWTAYAVALAAVLWFRVLVPTLRTRRHALRVAGVHPESDRAVSIEVTGRAFDALGASAGQFLTWRFASPEGSLRGWTRAHPYSLSAEPGEESLRVTVRTTGDDGPRLAALGPGTRVRVEGPYGPVGVGVRRHDRLLLIAAGIGITPFRAVLEALPISPGEVTVLHRVRDATDAVLGGELDRLAQERGIEVVRLGGHRRSAYSWLPEGVETDDTETLLALVPDAAGCDVRLCGPEEWTASVRRSLRAAGVARRSVREERFGW